MGRRATAADIDAACRALPEVEVVGDERPAYQVRGKTFVFFREPRPDAVDADGGRLTDVICFWVDSLADKEALVQDPHLPWFTTPHFEGHRSVLVRESELHRLTPAEVTEQVTEAWLARAPKSRAKLWLSEGR